MSGLLRLLCVLGSLLLLLPPPAPALAAASAMVQKDMDASLTSHGVGVRGVRGGDAEGGADGVEVVVRNLRLAVFSDPALVHLMATHHPNDPPSAAHQYITTVVSAVEKLLQEGVKGAGAEVELRLILVQMGVWAEEEAVPFGGRGLAGGTLRGFCQWVSARRPPKEHPAHWNHAMLLTGEDVFDSSPDALGTTYVGGLCHPQAACSVVEGRSFRAIYTAAHELAHSLGVPHDGEPSTTHCPDEGHIMGLTLMKDSYTWSPCSSNALGAILRNNTCLDGSEVQAIQSGEVDLGYLQVPTPELDHTQGGPPGQRYTADEQCRLAFGEGFKALAATTSICEYLRCTNGLVSQGAHPALPGTVCGRARSCQAGQCTEQQYTPTSASTQRPTWPPFQTSRPPFQTSRPPFQTSRPPFQNSRPPYQTSRPPFQTSRPPFQTSRPPFQTSRPPFQNSRPPYQTSRPPYQTTSSPYPTNQSPGEGSAFPLAVIPNEVSNIPKPTRCFLLPTFLHPFIGCTSSLVTPNSFSPLITLKPMLISTLKNTGKISVAADNTTTSDKTKIGVVSSTSDGFSFPQTSFPVPSHPNMTTYPPQATIFPSSSQAPLPSSTTPYNPSAHLSGVHLLGSLANWNVAQSTKPSTNNTSLLADLRHGNKPEKYDGNDESAGERENINVDSLTNWENINSNNPGGKAGNHTKKTAEGRMPQDVSQSITATEADPMASYQREEGLSNAGLRSGKQKNTEHGAVKNGGAEEGSNKSDKEENHDEISQSVKDKDNIGTQEMNAKNGYDYVDERDSVGKNGNSNNPNNYMDGNKSYEKDIDDVNNTPSNDGTNKHPHNKNQEEDGEDEAGQKNSSSLYSVRVFNFSGPDLQHSLRDILLPLLRWVAGDDQGEGMTEETKKERQQNHPSSTPAKQTTLDEVSTPGEDSIPVDVSTTSASINTSLKPLYTYQQRVERWGVAELREGTVEPPILAATASTYKRTYTYAPCSRSCGGGTQVVSQVCVEVMSEDNQVPEEMCDGLPNYLAPYTRPCNTFACHPPPRWVEEGWGVCSEWCGVGLQHRLVTCARPLLPQLALSTRPFTTAYFLPPSACPGHPPVDVRVCEGPCLPVNCTMPEHTFHPACTGHLPDPPLEKDHSISNPGRQFIQDFGYQDSEGRTLARTPY